MTRTNALRGVLVCAGACSPGQAGRQAGKGARAYLQHQLVLVSQAIDLQLSSLVDDACGNRNTSGCFKIRCGPSKECLG